MLGLPVNNIYRNIDQFKSFIQRLSRGEAYTLKLNKDKFEENQASVMKIMKNMAHELITVLKISQMLNNRKAHMKKLSKYFVYKTIKSKLRFSYKKVGSRPLKH